MPKPTFEEAHAAISDALSAAFETGAAYARYEARKSKAHESDYQQAVKNSILKSNLLAAIIAGGSIRDGKFVAEEGEHHDRG